MPMLNKKRVLPVALLFSLLIQASCARNPVTGQRELTLISEAQEIAYGREAHPQILSEFGRVEDPELQAYLDRVGQKLASISHRPDLEWHFNVVDVPVINAFALPGGYIYFTREILIYMNSEAELAGVLGHEIGHVTARHAVSQISKSQLLGLGLGVGSVLSPTVYQLSDFAQLGLGLLSLKYSRDDERQSDQLGVEYMSKAEYDPREVSKFFTVFQQIRGQQNESVPNWLSSHPAPPDRIRATAREAENLVRLDPDSKRIVDRGPFLMRIDGLVFGENPREGFQSEGEFVHPELRFKIRFPEGWTLQNSKQSVLSVAPGGSAALRLTLAETSSDTPEQYARQIAQQPGVELLQGEATRIGGHPAFLGRYRFEDEGGQLAGLAAFISFGGNLYEILALTSTQEFERYSTSFQDSLTSFSTLTDPKILNVQPDRVRIRVVREGETLGQIAEEVGHPRVDAEALSRLNRLDTDQPLSAGSFVKIVTTGLN